ncbi:MAG: hypothetical protein GY849_02370 [Deltaproteobacteria bacterium]|nr:hypothetical protein [Deltaproteobacteria bacterium]
MRNLKKKKAKQNKTISVLNASKLLEQIDNEINGKMGKIFNSFAKKQQIVKSVSKFDFITFCISIVALLLSILNFIF